MGSNSSSSVEVKIYNNTQNITLKNYSFYIFSGHCSNPPQPELSPGFRGICSFSGNPELGGRAGTTSVRGILVCDAESFSLAIYFYNPSDHNQFYPMLGLELSPGKAHLGDLETTYRRMAHGIYSSSDQDIKFTRNFVYESHGTMQLSHGPIKVKAAMSREASSTIKVVLQEQEQLMEAAKTKKPRSVKRRNSVSKKIQFDVPAEVLGKPGNEGEQPENPAGINGTP